jgi:hypothetical protein
MRQPSDEVFWFLAQVVDPAEVEFSEWYLDPLSDFDSSTGKAFLVARDKAVTLTYAAVRNEKPLSGTSSADIVRLDAVRGVSWPNFYHTDKTPITLEPGAINVTAEGWNVALPYTTLYAGAHAYLREVRAALKF